ncbi:MAG: GntR family transcriptional regulator [Phycisphaeraceae bacterium]|nr:GntR family transcriptional regulator [Phycisphaeraceae bacterium]
MLLIDSKPRNGHDLTRQLRQAVVRRRLRQGERLPTIRQIMDETGLTYHAVNQAIGVLCREGLLSSRKRAGTFVTENAQHSDAPAAALRVFALIGPELSTGFYPSLQKGFDQSARACGYQIITSNTDNDVHVQAETILRLMDMSVAGVAIVPATHGPSPAHHIRQLHQRGIPVVVLHRPIEGVAAPRIIIPAQKVGELAARQILKRGHRRVAFCASQRAGSSLAYEQGFRAALNAAGVELPDRHVDFGDIVLFNDADYAAYEQRLERWFDQHMSGPDRPTAIFTSFESIGEIAYLLALRRGLRVPQDLSIVSVGGRERHGAVMRRLACVTLDEQRAGELTTELLDQMHRGQRPLAGEQIFTIPIDFDGAESLSDAP